MDLREAQTLARTAMRAHGLTGWTFAFNNRKGAFGVCYHDRKQIKLSSILTQHASKAQVQQTIGHEIAHALVGHEAGHGPVWRHQMRAMGLVPDRCGEASDAQKVVLRASAKYVVTCAVAGTEMGTLNRIVKRRTNRKTGRTLIYQGHRCKCHGVTALYNGKTWDNIA